MSESCRAVQPCGYISSRLWQAAHTCPSLGRCAWRVSRLLSRHASFRVPLAISQGSQRQWRCS